ncbi:MAG: glycosyltransferase [Chitinophagales bacterium]|nr:glycosyltransferase [Chitinophagales bacterium]
MRILQLANKMPFPPKDGGAMGIHIFTEGLLQAGHQVKVIAVNSPKLFTPLHEINQSYKESTQFEAVEIDTRIKPLKALLNLFSNRSYNVERFDAPAMHQKLKEVLATKSFDIIQLESVFMAPYIATIKKYSLAKIVLRAHNIEHKIWERLAANEKNILKKWYLGLLAKRLKQYEINMLNQYHGITYITATEGMQITNLGCRIPTCHIPFAMQVKNKIPILGKEENGSVFSLAAMDWQPNVEGIQWFLDNVWALVLQKIPTAKFYIAGRNMNAHWLQKKYPQVEMVGEVKDANAFITEKSVMVVPLFSGGGVRVKIIEGFAMQKAIVATAIGAEGIEYKNNVHLLEANNSTAFAEQVITLLQNENQRNTIAQNGRKLAEQLYDIGSVITKLTHFYQTLLEEKK